MALKASCDGCGKEISLGTEVGLLRAGKVHYDMICEETMGLRLTICPACLKIMADVIGLNLTLLRKLA